MHLKNLSGRIHQQRGVSLLESLVAIVVMALGILGILGVQMRTLADTQTSVRRAQAIRLIEDLSERIKSNPNALGSTSGYTSAWAASLGTVKDCAITTGFPSSSCNAAEIAAYDRDRWIRSVRANMPLGDANVFVSPTDVRQLGVMLSWRENERERQGDSATDTNAYKAIFAPANTASAAVSCPSGSICHLQYISLTQRCLPYAGGLVYCPD